MSDETVPPSISMFENGPLQVEGPVPLIRQQIVKSENGEPMTYRTTAEVETAERYFLCRCGQSGNKPFCDGSHNPAGFTSDEVDPGTYAETSKALGGTGLTIRDDRSICVHAGFCGTRATNVWKMVADTDDSITRLQAIQMIEKCPSGALTYTLDGDTEANEPALPTEIAVLDDGPLYVMGGVPVTNSAGEPLETRNRVTLCRCGASKKKPLCDGSHSEAGFADRG